jgi:hypothetical protein
MNINAFLAAFGKTKEKKNIKECRTDNFIRNRKCTHPVEIADQSSENILGIDFLQKFRLQLDPKTKDLISADTDSEVTSGKTILSITDDTRTFTQIAVIANSEIDSTVSTIWHLWCQPYGPPETIMFNQGKVRTSKLESRINKPFSQHLPEPCLPPRISRYLLLPPL